MQSDWTTTLVGHEKKLVVAFENSRSKHFALQK
jgi:hypothetical protein